MANLPFGIFQKHAGHPVVVTRLGDRIIDLYQLTQLGLFQDVPDSNQVFRSSSLNTFISLGKNYWSSVRKQLLTAFALNSEFYHQHKDKINDITYKESDGRMLMPVHVGDYTDFYSSIEHATNVGIMFRDPANALLPNWKHLPVGYHGRSSSLVVSGTPIHRPKGQIKPNEQEPPVFAPSRQVDFELEMGFIVGKDSELGQSISTSQAMDYIFGMVLFNDLSARDIQKWEYVPLGPFLSKNFGSIVSPWIVTMEALRPYAITGPVQEPEVLPYLKFQGNHNYDIELEVYLSNASGSESKISHSNYRFMYWNMVQQLAHHTVNGCNIRVGDLYASGTISGPSPDSYGSMLELCWKGTKPILLPDGSARTFIEDWDTVSMKAYAGKGSQRVGFGDVTTQILPSK